MDISSSLLNSYTSAGIGGAQNASATKWRGGVTGWQHSEPKNTGATADTGAASALSYMADLKNFGGQLNTVTANLLSDSKSAFNQAVGGSSDKEAVSVNVANQGEANKLLASGGAVSVQVSQLAAAQQNAGGGVSATAISGVNAGYNTFSIQKGGNSYNFTVEVNSSDSNRTVQQKMADSINRQNTGVTASVQYDEAAKTSSLVLTAKDTGAAQNFTVADVSGDAAAVMGIDTATRQGQDASFSVNGQARTSASNTVDVGGGLSATFNKTTGADTVKLTAARDNTAVNNAVRDMVNSFNQLREAAMDNIGDRGAQKLQQRLDSITQAYGRSLSDAGITQNEHGYLQIDEAKLKTAVESGAAEKALGSDAGVTRRLNEVAKTADTNPNSFISYQSRGKATALSPDDLSGGDFMKNISFNPYQQNLLNQWNTVGMLFSAMV